MSIKRVLLGMSGGVDSSVSAVLLKNAGYEVVGLTMQMFETKTSSIEDAKKVCKRLGIEHYVLDCKKEFKENVINYFIKEYEECKTPNPCVECNKFLKFGLMYEKAKELNCKYIATGHYAKIEYSEEYKQYVLKKSDIANKDQTYFLYKIPKDILENIIFPLNEFKDKEEVRSIASKNGLEVAQKKDSQEICFIENNDYGSFLEKNMDKLPSKGDIRLTDGTIVGKHKGLIYYTIGQRKGLGISHPTPLYVIKLDKEKNEVIVGEEKDLYSNQLFANDINFTVNVDTSKKIEVMAKIRYRAKEALSILEMQENQEAKITFKEPQRAITPGQSVVFYINDILVGGGKII